MADTTSADTSRLSGFLMAVGTSRTSLWNERSSISGDLTGVIANCDNPVDVPAVASLLTLLDDMKANQTFVTTVRDALIEADQHGEGNPVIGDTTIDAGLEAAGVGTPPEEIDVAPVTLVGIPPTSGYVDDPICAANGNMIHQEADLIFPVVAGALNIVRTYNSLISDRVGAFGPGWSSVFDMRVDAAGVDASVTLGDGAAIPFVRRATGWVSTGRREVELFEADPAAESSEMAERTPVWRLVVDPVRSFDFDADGMLLAWSVGVARVAVRRGELGRIVRLDESVTGRSVSVEWAEGVVSSIAADDGRSVAYERSGASRIERAASHAGWIDYDWDGDLLRSVIDADGVVVFRNEYDEQRRVARQVSQHGRVTTYRYSETGSTVITGEDDGVRQAMVHDRRGNLTAVIDVDGSAMRFTYDRLDRVTHVVERDGADWSYVYDDRGDLIRRVDPDGAMVRWQWDDQHRLVAETDRSGATTAMEFDTDFRSASRVISADGSVVSQTLDDRGLPLTITDADGVITSFEWDADGQMLASVDAEGRSTTFEYDDHGLLARLTKPASTPTLLERDTTGRVLRTVTGEAESTHQYSPAGRMISGTEPGDVGWSSTFDATGQVATVTDALGSTASFEHDPLGNVIAVEAPDGGRYVNTYDARGQHVSAADPTGATSVKGYDVRGRLVEFADPMGHRWERTFDILGRTVSSTQPDGSTTQWSHHPNGEIASVTLSDGRTWTIDVDQLGRPVAVTDPLGGRAQLEYTAGGRLARRISPAGRIETYEYDRTGACSAIIGIDGERRAYERDERGFVSAVTDESVRREFAWDDDYRLLGIASPDGRSALERDAGGRVVSAADRSGVTAQFGYDQRGHLVEAFDAAGAPTAYAYDARGRLAEQQAPGERSMTFDYGDDGRLASVTDPSGVVNQYLRNANGATTGVRDGNGNGWDRTLNSMGQETERTGTDGAVVHQYEYDAAHRLTAASVPGADVLTQFLWDDADRLIGETTLDSGTRVERDADGWVTATVNTDGRRIDYLRDAAGRITAIEIDGDSAEVPDDGGDPYDPAGRLSIGPDGTLYRYDDAGRIAEIAPDASEPTTFTYTVDGLVDVETGPNGARSFRYDRSGRVAGIDVAGVGSTAIAYDDAGRRVREVGPDGAVTSYDWDGLGRLVRIERESFDNGAIDVRYDALGRPVFVADDRVEFDPVSGRMSRLGESDFVSLGADRFDVASRSWSRTGPTAPLGGVPAGHVFIVGARVLDPSTHQFLSADPLLAVAGSSGAASAYTYAWNDPINRVDPSGLRPISIEEADAMRTREEQGRVGQFVEAVKNDPWGTLAAVGVVAVGVGLMFVPGGQAIGAGILIGAGTNMAIGFATGTFSPTSMAVSGVFGALPGGSTLRTAVYAGAAKGAAETVVTSALTGNGFPSPGALVFGTATGAGGDAAQYGIGRLLRGAGPGLDTPTSTASLDHTPTATVIDIDAPAAVSVNTGDVSVYTSIDTIGGVDSINYVGITNDIERRAAEHLASKGIVIQEIPGLSNLSRADAHAVEQVLIEANGGPNGQLLNRINSIATSNPIYETSIARGTEILESVGYQLP